MRVLIVIDYCSVYRMRMTCIISIIVNPYKISQNKYIKPNRIKERIKETYQRKRKVPYE